MELSENLYVYEDTIFTEERYSAFKNRTGVDIEPDYVYYTPDVYELRDNYFLIANLEETFVELAENVDGLIRSVGVINDSKLVRAIINLVVREE